MKSASEDGSGLWGGTWLPAARESSQLGVSTCEVRGRTRTETRPMRLNPTDANTMLRKLPVKSHNNPPTNGPESHTNPVAEHLPTVDGTDGRASIILAVDNREQRHFAAQAYPEQHGEQVEGPRVLEEDQDERRENRAGRNIPP